MKKENFNLNNIPAVLYGDKTDKLFLYVHGKNSYKEEAENLAKIVIPQGYQVLSFDLPEHGERKGSKLEFTVQNCIPELQTVLDFVIGGYKKTSLYACSIGAYFSLSAYKDIAFDKCLFVSPILDMERLIRNIMMWANVTVEELKSQKKIETSFGETLLWDYYCYVKDNPVDIWKSETFILYGENDNLTERSVIESFQKKYDCSVRIMNNGEHYFNTPEQMDFLDSWVKDIIKYGTSNE